MEDCARLSDPRSPPDEWSSREVEQDPQIRRERVQ